MSPDLSEPQVAHREMKGLDHLAFKELSHPNIVGLTQYGLRMKSCHIDSHFSQQRYYIFSGKKNNKAQGNNRSTMYMKVQTAEKSDLEKNNSLWQKACLIFVNINKSQFAKV